MDNNDFNDIEQMINDAKKDVPKHKKSKKIKSNRILTVTKPQNQFLNLINTDKREMTYEHCFSGGTGSGKSYALCLQLLRYVQVPNTKVLLTHNFLSVLKKTTLQLLLNSTISKAGEVLPPLLPPECIKRFNKSNMELELTNGSVIVIKGCNDDGNIRSLNLVAAFVDELSNISYDSYQEILRRCRVFNKNPCAVFCATNPASSKSHWIYKYYVDKQIPLYRTMLKVSSYTNRENLPESYIKSLENLPELERQKFLNGEWLNSGNSVFYTFNPDLHVKNLENWKSEDYDDFILGNDAGGGSATSYSGTCLIGRKNNKYYVLEEMSKVKTSHGEILSWLEKYRHLTELVGYDPANQCFCTDLENNGWKPLKPDKNIEMGVAKINSLFNEGRLFVSTKCEKCKKEFEEAFRNPNTEKWDKTSGADCVDAIRYGIICFDNNELMDKNSPAYNINPDVFIFSL